MFDHILIIGLGSIGRRHLGHFRALGVKRIDALRSGKATLPDAGHPDPDNTYYTSTEAFLQKPQAVVICTPSALHTSYILEAIENGCHILCEKPVADSRADFIEIKKRLEKSDVTFAVAHNLRFHPIVQFVYKSLREGSFGAPVAAIANFCAYMPDWHPWEDYHDSYVARKDLGGGAALTHIHEIDYLTWWFGRARAYHGFYNHVSTLGTDVDESTSISIAHERNTISQVLLSLNIKPANRKCTIFFSDSRLEIDLLKGTVFHIKADLIEEIEVVSAGFNFDDTYREQAKAFWMAANGGTENFLCTIDEALHDTEIALNIA